MRNYDTVTLLLAFALVGALSVLIGLGFLAYGHHQEQIAKAASAIHLERQTLDDDGVYAVTIEGHRYLWSERYHTQFFLHLESCSCKEGK